MKLILAFAASFCFSAMGQNTSPIAAPKPAIPTPEQCAQNPVYYCSTQHECCDEISSGGSGASAGGYVDPCGIPDYGLGCDSSDPLGAAACFCN